MRKPDPMSSQGLWRGSVTTLRMRRHGEIGAKRSTGPIQIALQKI